MGLFIYFFTFHWKANTLGIASIHKNLCIDIFLLKIIHYLGFLHVEGDVKLPKQQ